MKRALLTTAMLVMAVSMVKASGVCIVDAYEGIYFQLLSNQVSVLVNDQIATVTTTQEFRNYTGADRKIKYAFPLHEEASATSIRWKLSGVWYTAFITPTPQDTTLPGGGGGGNPDPNLVTFLGETPLYFNLLDTIPADSSIVIEITYVQLLPYSFSKVDFFFPNNYLLIQSDPLNLQRLDLKLYSQRDVENIELLEPQGGTVINQVDSASIFFEVYESPALFDYSAEYTLNSDELGLFSYSTLFPDTMEMCDDYGRGFFTFIVEPDANDSLYIIPKVFTLIIDRSGSMAGYTVNGTKMEQAKEAAIYIVNNLNEGDYFNIVDFSTSVASFMPDHVPFNSQSQQAAIAYINPMQPTNLTNISGAFEVAIPDFANSDTTVANIIIFLTDGQATTGITSTDGILDHIQDLIQLHEVSNLSIHTFGIGDDVNQQLLSQIASQNDGLCQFLENEELETAITEFYNMIRNPVLLNPQLTIDPPIIVEPYPNPIPNLYLGQQLIMTGRYGAADSVTVTFSGEAFGLYQEYTYGIQLADTNLADYQFLTKLWAKQKMENLYILYFTYPPNSSEAEEIKNEIVDISICYNVISPFTSYTGGGTVMIEEGETLPDNDPQQLCTVYPNPFSSVLYFKLHINDHSEETAVVRIFDITGRQLVTLQIPLHGNGTYVMSWDGLDAAGIRVGKGIYFYTVTIGEQLVSGKISRL